MEIIELRLDQVRVGDRLRLVNAEKAAQLAVSISELGQITPIEVGPADEEGRHPLIVGAHRFEAHVLAARATILAVVFTGDADQVRLHEIDENLYRHELSPFDQAAFLAERRTIFERMKGDIKPGRPRTRGNRSKLLQLSFFDETTERFGLPRDTIKRALRRRSRIAEDVWLKLQRSGITLKGVELDAIARLGAGEQRQVMVELTAKTKPAPSIAVAIQRVMGAPKKRAAFDTLVALWAKASAKDRAQFLAHLAERKELGQ